MKTLLHALVGTAFAAANILAQESTVLVSKDVSLPDVTVVQNIIKECGLPADTPEKIMRLENSRVVVLDLSNSDLSRDGLTTLPAAIGRLTELRVLVAKRNRISSLPPELFKLTKLQRLDLANNKIASLPSSIGLLENLDTLDLRSNRLDSLPREIGSLKKLVVLQLWNNKLSRLEPAITQLPALKELYLTNNRLTDLPDNIIRMKSLMYIDVDGNKFCNLSQKKVAWIKEKNKEYNKTQKCGWQPPKR